MHVILMVVAPSHSYLLMVEYTTQKSHHTWNTNPRKYNVCYIPEKIDKRVYLTSFRVVKPWIHVILRSSYILLYLNSYIINIYWKSYVCISIWLQKEKKNFLLFFLLEIIYENKRDDEIRKKNKIIYSFIDGKI